jgi:hypothetical protein
MHDSRGTEPSGSSRPYVAMVSSLAFFCNNRIEANRLKRKAQGKNWKVMFFGFPCLGGLGLDFEEKSIDTRDQDRIAC